jgi:2-polyprenyl-3-methyl-5-hydroxy-6-metoxy-1,4-benzoquinol methylase
MEAFDNKAHWETIYKTKDSTDVSWYQAKPETSLMFFEQYNVPLSAKIIDIGGGDSLLVDNLLSRGYKDISVLDISESAIQRAQERLGEQSKNVTWIVNDIRDFTPTIKYDFWHDRAAFHFLTNENDIEKYLQTAQQSLKPGGLMVVGTFSETGPTRCSGIDIKQYSETSMTDRLQRYFDKIKCIEEDHTTPFGTVQNFVFCSFRKS